MKKGQWGARLVVAAAMIATAGLFFYWDQVKQESYTSLQDQLNEIQLQRFEELKGGQVKNLALEAARQVNEFAEKMRAEVESAADSKPLRQAARTPVQIKSKIQAWEKIQKEHGSWASGTLTDEKGIVLASTEKKLLGTNWEQSGNFKSAVFQRMTRLRLEQEKNGEFSRICISVPCLTDQGAFAGLLEVQVPFPAEMVENWRSKNGVLTMLGNEQGQRLTRGPSEAFPKNFGSLLGKNQAETEGYIKSLSSAYSRAVWEGSNYLLGIASTLLPGVKVFSLLKVSGLEKLVQPGARNTPAYLDPVIWAGLTVVFLISWLLLMFVRSPQTGVPVKRINQKLGAMLRGEETLEPVFEAEGGGEWEAFLDLLNELIQRTQNLPTPGPERLTEPAEVEQFSKLNLELSELRQSYDQALAKNLALEHQYEEQDRLNRELQLTLQATESEQKNFAMTTEWLEKVKEAGTVRITAIQNMSEDLKATLVVIKNYISSILSSGEGKITDTEQEFLGVVINKSARLERQINDLLDLSHMESADAQLYLAPAEIGSMIQDVILNAQPQAETKQIKLISEIQAQLPKVKMDGDRLGQVFINLMQQAIKITPVGGTIRVLATQSVTDVVVKIQDGGAPLTLEQARNVFSSFHGLETVSGQALAGSGLRFAIVKQIMDRHHGSVTIRGIPDQGNEVVVTLPIQGQAAAELEKQAPTVKTDELVVMRLNGESQEGKEKSEPEVPPAVDLSEFMGREAGAPGGEFAVENEDLDKLLKDIENSENKKS